MPKIVKLVTDILQIIIDIWKTLADYATHVVDEITTLHRKMANQTGSMAGRWPTTDFT